MSPRETGGHRLCLVPMRSVFMSCNGTWDFFKPENSLRRSMWYQQTALQVKSTLPTSLMPDRENLKRAQGCLRCFHCAGYSRDKAWGSTIVRLEYAWMSSLIIGSLAFLALIQLLNLPVPHRLSSHRAFRYPTQSLHGDTASSLMTDPFPIIYPVA